MGEPCVRITANNVQAYLLAAETKEEETLGNEVDYDVEGIGGSYRPSEYTVGHAAG